jgi:hypothetical protein
MLATDSYYSKYLNVVAGQSAEEALQTSLDSFLQLYPTITEDKWAHRYAPGKWSIKELVQHITDAERIFNFRALSFARGETQSLPAFEEDAYAQNSFADYRTGSSIAQEFIAVRNSTLLLYKGFAPDVLNRTGSANNIVLSVKEVGLIMAGHQMHHIAILKERYL